jgi:hypothetical protein
MTKGTRITPIWHYMVPEHLSFGANMIVTCSSNCRKVRIWFRLTTDHVTAIHSRNSVPNAKMSTDASAMSLFSAGLLMGIVHVLSGPDHICVLAALSVNGSWRAFWLGVRWAIGHSAGLFIVAIVFIALKDSIDLELIELIGLVPVAIFMIILGIAVIGNAFRVRGIKQKERVARQQRTAGQIMSEDWVDLVEVDLRAPQVEMPKFSQSRKDSQGNCNTHLTFFFTFQLEKPDTFSFTPCLNQCSGHHRFGSRVSIFRRTSDKHE